LRRRGWCVDGEHRGSAALLWSLALLAADALAPVMGATITLLVTIPQEILGLCLGFLAGVLLYLASSDILPVDVRNGQAEPHRREAHGHP
jgi:zinc transporter ZupT